MTRCRDSFNIKQELFNLLDSVPANITEQLVLKTVGERKQSDHWLTKLLDAHDDEVVISEQVLIASMRPSSSTETVIQVLQERRPRDLIVTDNVLIACVENCNRTAFDTILTRHFREQDHLSICWSKQSFETTHLV